MEVKDYCFSFFSSCCWIVQPQMGHALNSCNVCVSLQSHCSGVLVLSTSHLLLEFAGQKGWENHQIGITELGGKTIVFLSFVPDNAKVEKMSDLFRWGQTVMSVFNDRMNEMKTEENGQRSIAIRNEWKGKEHCEKESHRKECESG